MGKKPRVDKFLQRWEEYVLKILIPAIMRDVEELKKFLSGIHIPDEQKENLSASCGNIFNIPEKYDSVDSMKNGQWHIYGIFVSKRHGKTIKNPDIVFPNVPKSTDEPEVKKRSGILAERIPSGDKPYYRFTYLVNGPNDTTFDFYTQFYFDEIAEGNVLGPIMQIRFPSSYGRFNYVDFDRNGRVTQIEYLKMDEFIHKVSFDEHGVTDIWFGNLGANNQINYVEKYEDVAEQNLLCVSLNKKGEPTKIFSYEKTQEKVSCYEYSALSRNLRQMRMGISLFALHIIHCAATYMMGSS